MVASVGLRVHLRTGTTMQQRLYSNTMAATGTGAENVSRDRDKIIDRSDKTHKDRFKATMKHTALFRKAGYRVIEAWACEVGRIDDVDLPKVETKSYPHTSIFDFETFGDNYQRKEVTPMLTIENMHEPISVSFGDTLKREPTHICERDPAALVSKFAEELESRGKE